MRLLLAVTLAVFLATDASAADTVPSPLPPGKLAGLKQAQAQDDPTLLYVLGAGAVIAGAVLLASSGNNNASNPVSSTTSTTP